MTDVMFPGRATCASRTARLKIDRLIADLAARQHGVVARYQLLELGVLSDAIRRRVQAKRLVPIHPGVFAVGHSKLTRYGWWMAAVLACGPGAVLSHQSAAALHGLLGYAGSRVHISSVSQRGRNINRIRLHIVRNLDRADTTMLQGIPVTTIHRTLLDLAETVPPNRLRHAFEQAEKRELFDRNEMQRTVERNPGRHGLKTLLPLLQSSAGPPPDTRSPREDDFVDLCRDHGLPMPHTNVVIEGITVDARFPGTKLIVEIDAYGTHGSRSQFEEDRRRDTILQLAGYTVLRITDRRMLTEAILVVADIRAALSRSS